MQAAEDWIRKREAIRLPDSNRQWRHAIKCDGRKWLCTSRTDANIAVVDGVEYPLKYPVRLRNDVQYVVDIVDGVAEFNVDVALDANWNEPMPAQTDKYLTDRRSPARKTKWRFPRGFWNQKARGDR